MDTSQTFVVRGQVRHADGSPFTGAQVQAFDRDLRREQVLGQQTTDTAGRYEIRYPTAAFARAEKASADLVVRRRAGRRALVDAVQRAGRRDCRSRRRGDGRGNPVGV